MDQLLYERNDVAVMPGAGRWCVLFSFGGSTCLLELTLQRLPQTARNGVTAAVPS